MMLLYRNSLIVHVTELDNKSGSFVLQSHQHKEPPKKGTKRYKKEQQMNCIPQSGHTKKVEINRRTNSVNRVSWKYVPVAVVLQHSEKTPLLGGKV